MGGAIRKTRVPHRLSRARVMEVQHVHLWLGCFMFPTSQMTICVLRPRIDLLRHSTVVETELLWLRGVIGLGYVPCGFRCIRGASRL